MSDGIWIALITGVVGPLVLAYLNHWLGARDRELASDTVKEQSRRIRSLQQRVRMYERRERLRRAKRRGRR